jgi:transposase InsO family protein
MISSIALTGNRVSYRGLKATLTVLPDTSVALTFDEERHKTLIKSRSELEAELHKTLYLIPKGQVASPKALDLSVLDLDEINRRSAYIRELRRVTSKNGIGGTKIRQQVIARVAREIGDSHPISPAQLARWASAANQSPHGVAVTLNKGTRRRKSSFSQEIQDFALEMIDDHYLKLGKPTVQYAYNCFREELEAKFESKKFQRVDPPCRETFRKWIKGMEDPIEHIRKREGKRAAKEASRNATKKIRVDRILERVEADAVSLAIGVKDETGRYLGPVTIFAVIDCYSRSILGLVVQVGRGESSGSVIDSYKHAICPKPADYLPSSVESDYPMYGVPEAIISDGGAGYASIATHAFVVDAGSESRTVESYAGWKKPFIERFFLTLRTGFAQNLRSYCGKFTDRPNLDATIQEKASMTLGQFRTALYEWLLDTYHHSPHRGLEGRSPYDVWQEQVTEWPPYLPTNFERIQLTKGETRTCVISGKHSHQGVCVNKLQYNDPDDKIKLIGMRLRNQGRVPEVTVQYTYNDVSSVNVIDPETEEIIQAFVTDERVPAGMSYAELEARRGRTYKAKGFTGKPRAKSSKTVLEANSAHDAQMRSCASRKSSDAPTEKIHEVIRSGRDDREEGIEIFEEDREESISQLPESTPINFNGEEDYADD